MNELHSGYILLPIITKQCASFPKILVNLNSLPGGKCASIDVISGVQFQHLFSDLGAMNVEDTVICGPVIR